MYRIDNKKVLHQSQQYEKQMVEFLLDLIAIPSQSGHEEAKILRVEQEMEKVGFDNIKIDRMGNIIGKIGSGKTIILMDAHIDTVGTGDINEWKSDPFKGTIKNGIIYGRGASDQTSGMVSLIYAVKLINDLKLLDDYTLYVTGTCHEEACEGLAFFHIFKDENLFKPDFVVLSEPTNLKVNRGHPGRMEIKITTKGKACHSSRPQDGINAIYKMQPIIEEIEKLNEKLHTDTFLGKGTISVTMIECKTPALCAIPNECTIFIDRRLTLGESKELAIQQLKDIIEKTNNSKDTIINILQYEAKAWTDLPLSMEKYFPGWLIEENHVLTQTAFKAAEMALEATPKISKWAFSTNGVASMGTLGIPTIGFGPANDIYAHTVEDQVPIEHLVKAAAFYAIFPGVLVSKLKSI
ncbi:MAG: YgeY family selenium metabolism-linked hydrolase [Cyanobacteriota bacterium]